MFDFIVFISIKPTTDKFLGELKTEVQCQSVKDLWHQQFIQYMDDELLSTSSADSTIA